ncbi:MAG: hypothetical protein ABSE85_18950 [Candidatus Korobacteraceae bacterium]
MKTLQSFSRRGASPTILTLALGLALAISSAVPGHAQSLFRQLSQDSFTNGSSQHMTEVASMAAVALTSAGQPRLMVELPGPTDICPA